MHITKSQNLQYKERDFMGLGPGKIDPLNEALQCVMGEPQKVQ